jgi:hypothetical protein
MGFYKQPTPRAHLDFNPTLGVRFKGVRARPPSGTKSLTLVGRSSSCKKGQTLPTSGEALRGVYFLSLSAFSLGKAPAASRSYGP